MAVTRQLGDLVLKQVNQNEFDNYFSRKNVLYDSFMNECTELGSMTLWSLPISLRFNMFRRHLLKYSYKRREFPYKAEKSNSSFRPLNTAFSKSMFAKEAVHYFLFVCLFRFIVRASTSH